eukprot:1156876-Pelagomonas_calceolata.AAC.11
MTCSSPPNPPCSASQPPAAPAAAAIQTCAAGAVRPAGTAAAADAQRTPAARAPRAPAYAEKQDAEEKSKQTSGPVHDGGKPDKDETQTVVDNFCQINLHVPDWQDAAQISTDASLASIKADYWTPAESLYRFLNQPKCAASSTRVSCNQIKCRSTNQGVSQPQSVTLSTSRMPIKKDTVTAAGQAWWEMSALTKHNERPYTI